MYKNYKNERISDVHACGGRIACGQHMDKGDSEQPACHMTRANIGTSLQELTKVQ